jgi:DNA-binding transcriptional LysR family regulator
MQLDAALTRTPFLDERLEVHALATEPRVFVLPSGHPASDAEAATLLDFQDEPFVALGERAPVARDYWLALEQRGGELPTIAAEAYTAGEIVHGVVHLGALAIGLEGCRGNPWGFTVVDAPELPDNTIALVVRAHDTRPIVQDLVDLVPRVIAQHADLAPSITPLAHAMTGA